MPEGLMRPNAHKMFLIALTALIWTACSEKQEDPVPKSIYSVNGGTSSHNNGEICQNCHVTGGAGKYDFIVAGSVFKSDTVTPSPNGILYFWSEQGGTGELVATLEVDANGNFFTTFSILPGEGAYPQMRGVSGDVRNMPIPASTGACNSCHGVNEKPIWIN